MSSRINPLLASLKGGLIVSCQAKEGDPFNDPQSITGFARAAELGGAVGIRAQGVANIRAVKAAVKLPVIGMIKSRYADGAVLITPDFEAVENIVKSGADLVALDVTQRIRPNGLSGPDFLREVKRHFSVPLMADISTFEEGGTAAEAGADVIATTLSGYTPYTRDKLERGPDFDLIEKLTAAIDWPIIAEGRIWTPAEAQRCLELGAFAVVVGTAITRPQALTQRFVEAMAQFAYRDR